MQMLQTHPQNLAVYGCGNLFDIEACVQEFFGRTVSREEKTGLQKILSDLLKQ